MHREILIIGGGPAGVEAALTASKYAQNVTIITKERVGEWKAGYTNILLSNIDSIRNHGGFSNQFVEDIYNDWVNHQTDLLAQSGVQIIHGAASMDQLNIENTDLKLNQFCRQSYSKS